MAQLESDSQHLSDPGNKTTKVTVPLNFDFSIKPIQPVPVTFNPQPAWKGMVSQWLKVLFIVLLVNFIAVLMFL